MRSNYSREERQKIVEEYIQSGKSQTVFAPEYGIKLENQCSEISDEDIVQALNDDDLFDRKSERKKPGRTRNKSKNLPRQKYVIDLSEEEKICSNCRAKMVKVREIVSERIVLIIKYRRLLKQPRIFNSFARANSSIKQFFSETAN